MLHLSQVCKDEASCIRGSDSAQAVCCTIPRPTSWRAQSWASMLRGQSQHRLSSRRHSVSLPHGTLYTEQDQRFNIFEFDMLILDLEAQLKASMIQMWSSFQFDTQLQFQIYFSQCRSCSEKQTWRTTNWKQTDSVQQHWAARWMKGSCFVMPALVW